MKRFLGQPVTDDLIIFYFMNIHRFQAIVSFAGGMVGAPSCAFSSLNSCRLIGLERWQLQVVRDWSDGKEPSGGQECMRKPQGRQEE